MERGKLMLLLVFIFLFGIGLVLAQTNNTDSNQTDTNETDPDINETDPDINETDDNETDDSGCEWDCTRWSECADGKRTRECTNVNSCDGDSPKTEVRCRVREGNKTSQGIGQELREMIRERKAEIREGNFTGPQGQLLNVREMVSGLIAFLMGCLIIFWGIFSYPKRKKQILST